MKFAALLSAGLIAAAAMVPATASAQERHHRRVVARTVVHTQRHAGYRPQTRQVCRVVYRHHQRVRNCRTVRR